MTNQTPSNLLSHRYKVLSLLGDGGFGKTFLVEDTQIPSNRRCVVKQLKLVHDNPQLHQMVQARFQREAAVLERLGDGHDQIPRLYAYFSQGDQFYLVEEWVEGDTLTQKVQREGSQSEETVRSLLLQLLPVIDYVHQQQIVHRDIKPDNIIVRHRDGKPVLIDFGAVKEALTTIINSQGNTSHSIVIGTPGYMPSEQLAGRPVFSSDIYSLGMTAIFMLTGRIPQQLDTNPSTGAINWRQYAPTISSELAGVLDRSIHLQSHLRYSSAAEMATALQAQPIAGALPPPMTPLQTTIESPHMPTVQSPAPSIRTEAVAPAHSEVQTVRSSGGEWQKAVLISSIIGVSILGGAWMLRSHPSLVGSSTPSQSPSPPTPTQPLNPDPPQQPQQPAPPQIRSASEGNGTGASNATISDPDSTTNVRTGPGTNNAVDYTARRGDRVQILGNAKDASGNTWYRVVFAKSGAEGWVSARLVQLDAPTNPQPLAQPSDPLSKPTNPPNNKVSSVAHQGYCTFLSANRQGDVINDRCTIYDNQNGSYQLKSSDGSLTTIVVEPTVQIEGASASIVQRSSTGVTVKGAKGSIGFCWNCNP